jgi:hypothetical protein
MIDTRETTDAELREAIASAVWDGRFNSDCGHRTADTILALIQARAAALRADYKEVIAHYEAELAEARTIGGAFYEEARTALERIEKLSPALKPFAEAAKQIPDEDGDNRSIDEHAGCCEITNGDLRRARAALEGKSA